jgi:hypothetical protein
LVRRFLIVAFVALALWATPASAGALTLHPDGFGPMSYSAWKAQEGLPDSNGNSNQALYFQKTVPTPTNAAGVASINGLEGMPASALTGLSWKHREDGHCGAGAPRWDLFVTNPDGSSHIIFLGCNAAAHSEAGFGSGHGWCQDSYAGLDLQAQILGQGGTLDATINGLAIVFDEGNDTANPPPTGCAQEQLTGGFVFLDDVTVTAGAVSQVFTSPADNGNH